MFRLYRYLLLLGVIFALGSCVPPGELVNRNFAACYRPDQQAATPPEFVFHQTGDSTVRVFVRINAEKLLFTRQDNGSFLAFCGVHVQVVRSYETPALLDSISFMHSVSMEQRNRFSHFQFDMPVRASGELLATIRLTDMNSGNQELRYQRFRMGGVDSRNSFRLTGPAGEPIFVDWLTQADSFRLHHRDTALGPIFVRYYKRDFPLAAPPFGIDNRVPFDYRADSTYRVDLSVDSLMRLDREGFYMFSKDSSSKDGFAVFCFPKGYPKVIETEQLLEPVRFLTVRSEFAALQDAPSLRKAMDDFWLARCNGSKEKSRQLIQKYYQRVQWANRLFSSYTEGWRTDRGMLYIVMGAPNNVIRSSNTETWVYGTMNSPAALNFMFLKVDNPFTDNDFSLTRSPIYENAWYRAVDSWRQGRAYNTID